MKHVMVFGFWSGGGEILQDLESVDVANGLWFSCKFCKNAKDKDGKYYCRSGNPFSPELVTGKAGHFENRTHKERKKAAITSPADSPVPAVLQLLAAAPAPALLPAPGEPSATEASAPSELPKEVLRCQGLGFEITDASWNQLYRLYAYYVEGADRSSKKLVIKSEGEKYSVHSTSCEGEGKKGWRHKVVCCKQCHEARTDPNNSVKVALLICKKLRIAADLMAAGNLTDADREFLQHAVVERPLAQGNENFKVLRDTVKMKILSLENETVLPEIFRNWSSDNFLREFVKAVLTGKLSTLEKSIVYHMMLNFLQRLNGQPTAQLSSKLFAFCRGLRTLNRSSYEFFRSNTLVGPHIKTIQKAESKQKESDDPIVVDTPEAIKKRMDIVRDAYMQCESPVLVGGKIPCNLVIDDTKV